MSFGSGDVPPEGRRGPLSGSASLWTGLAVVMVVLTILVIIPTLGQGPSSQGTDDPFVDAPVVPTDPAATPPQEAPLTS